MIFEIHYWNEEALFKSSNSQTTGQSPKKKKTQTIQAEILKIYNHLINQIALEKKVSTNQEIN
jgi:hypothetical protein